MIGDLGGTICPESWDVVHLVKPAGNSQALSPRYHSIGDSMCASLSLLVNSDLTNRLRYHDRTQVQGLVFLGVLKYFC